jgi:hypothetical protein
MTDYVFIGRRRHPARTFILGTVTLGIYGRILLYKQVKEIDGHRALFIDLRVITLLVCLPIFGPLAVKFKLRRLMSQTVARDVTHPRVHHELLVLAAFVPIVPVFHALVQRHLNIYWRRQQKIDDIRHRRADIDKLRQGRMTDEKKAAIKEIEGQIQRRQDALDAEEQAATAIREAEAERRKAEEELKRLHKGPVARLAAKAKATVPKGRRQRSGAVDKQEEPEGSGRRLAALRGRFGGRKADREEDREEPAARDGEPDDEGPGEERRPSLLKRRPRRSGPDEDEAEQEETERDEVGVDEADEAPSRSERKAAKKEAKRRAKEAREADKAAKAKAKADERQAKKEAKADERQAKQEAKAKQEESKAKAKDPGKQAKAERGASETKRKAKQRSKKEGDDSG